MSRIVNYNKTDGQEKTTKAVQTQPQKVRP